jgi:hypothetical protein
MRINFAHFWEPSTNGGRLELAVFEANAQNGTDYGRDEVLSDLTVRARLAGYEIDKSALAYQEHGRIRFYGDQDLVTYLANRGVPRWTHYLDV